MSKNIFKRISAFGLTMVMVVPLFMKINTYAENRIVDTFYVLNEEGNPITVEVTQKDLEKEADKRNKDVLRTYMVEDVDGEIVDDKGAEPTITEDIIGIVRFNRAKSTIYYTDLATGKESYISPYTATDAAFLRSEEDSIICRLSGVTMKVAMEDVDSVVDYEGQNVSRYYISNDYLIHAYSYYSGDSLVPTSTRVGYKPEYLCEGKTYYSYDGHYFYETFETMISDYRNNTYAHSVNSTAPYYNYYQYLTLRTKAVFSGEQYDAYIVRMKPNVESALKNSGNYFVSTQDIYTINSLLMLGVSINETGWGTSSLALKKNNLFGLNAVDGDAYGNANTYPSVEACIQYYAYVWMQNKYLSGANYRYSGAHLGDKSSGINVSYASDPYWGEKGAARGYYYDTEKADYGRYTIGIATSGIIKLYKEADTTSKVIYTSASGTNDDLFHYPVIIQDTVTGDDGNTYYKIASDMALMDDRSSRDVEEQYMPSRDYVYAKAEDVQIVFTGSGVGTDIEDPEKVENLKPDFNPVIPPTTEEPTTEEEPVTPPADKEGTVVISKEDITDALADTTDRKVVITITETEVPVENIQLPVESLHTVATADKSLTLETKTASVTFDSSALLSVAEQAGGNATIELNVAEIEQEKLNNAQQQALEKEAKKVAAVISAEILCNGEIISDFNGGIVKVEIPFILEEGMTGGDYIVAYIADDGAIEYLETAYTDGCIIVELEHFSEYVILEKEKQNIIIGDADGNGKVNSRDAVAILRYIIMLPNDKFDVVAADTNGNGRVDSRDAVKILRNIIGLQ